MKPVETLQVLCSIRFLVITAQILMTMAKFVFRWNRNESGSLFGHRVAIIEDLPKPVKNACDPQRSNTLKARNDLKNTLKKVR